MTDPSSCDSCSGAVTSPMTGDPSDRRLDPLGGDTGDDVTTAAGGDSTAPSPDSPALLPTSPGDGAETSVHTLCDGVLGDAG